MVHDHEFLESHWDCKSRASKSNEFAPPPALSLLLIRAVDVGVKSFGRIPDHPANLLERWTVNSPAVPFHAPFSEL